jgi:hypothetical protein
VEVLDLDAEIVGQRLVEIDAVMRPHAVGVEVVSPDGGRVMRVTWPAQIAAHHAGEYLVGGDPDVLERLRSALGRASRRDAGIVSGGDGLSVAAAAVVGRMER